MNRRTFDAIVIGAGQAGPALTARLSTAGLSVALVERRSLGGTCVNTGCTPTKTLVASAEVAHRARHAAEFGVSVSQVAMNMQALLERKNAVVARSRESLENWMAGLPGCTLFRGHARFESARSVSVDDSLLCAERIFINVGGRATVPALPGIGSVAYLTNSSILDLKTLPEHLVVIGGSYIGLEFAQMYRRFGSKVTLIEKGPRLLGHEDPDVSVAIQSILEQENIAVRTAAECIHLEPRGEQIAVGVDCTSGEPVVCGSHVLLAVGRTPNTQDLNLHHAGVCTDARGFIEVDGSLQTNVPGIWALGDCNGRGAFTHTAYNDFEIVAANLLDGGLRRVSDRIPCYALFIDPPLGRAGMTETEARASGRRIRVGSRPMTRVGRAVEKGQTQGFMKIVVDADSEAILGASVLGVGGDEAVHCILDTMAAKVPYTQLMRTMHIHPTVSELIPTMLGELTP